MISIQTINGQPVDGEADTMQARLHIAVNAEINERLSLETVIKRVGVTPAYSGEDVHLLLMGAIERYAKATARAEMLRILATEDFFIAMARSASKTGSS